MTDKLRGKEKMKDDIELLFFCGIGVGKPLFIWMQTSSEKNIIKYVRQSGVGKQKYSCSASCFTKSPKKINIQIFLTV